MVDIGVSVMKAKKKKSVKARARERVIETLEMNYMDLEMEMDACQGCMENLDVAFKELDILKKLIRYLGGDIDAHKQEVVDKWWELNVKK